MRPQRIALVTGANQGIGFALVQGLAARLGSNDLVLLTGRHPGRVADAVERVRRNTADTDQPGGGPDRGEGRSGRARVEGRVLDVTDADAVNALAADLTAQYGGVDIVISNAIGPLTPDRPQAEQADTFVAVANGGTHAVLRAFGPVLRPGGRLIVVASSFGTLDNLEAKLHPLFADGRSLDQIEAAVDGWLAAVHAGTAQDEGWPEWINTPSKVGQVAAVRAYAATRRDADLANGTLIASVCPGLVRTRASLPWFDDFSRAREPEEAVQPLLDLILTDQVDPSAYGELIRDGKVLPWLGRFTA